MPKKRKGSLAKKVMSNKREVEQEITNIHQRIDKIMELYEKKGLDAAIDYIVFHPRF